MEFAEVGPVDLGLLAGEGSKSKAGFGGWFRTQTRDDGAEVVGGAGVAAGAHHFVEARGGETGILLQGLDEEGDEGVDDGAAYRLLSGGDPGLGQDASHGGVMDLELGGQGTDAPVLGVIEAQALGFELPGDHR